MTDTWTKTFQLEILTPDKKVFSGEVTYLKAPGAEGYLGILANHAPMLAALQIGELEIEIQNQRQFFALSGGFLEVLNNHVRLLAETAEAAQNIDVARALAAKERAAKRLLAKAAGIDLDRAKLSLLRALNRLKIAENQ